MSNQINSSDLFVALSDEQQELVTGGADFELSGSNYANKLSAMRGATTSGPQGSTAVSIGASNNINTAAQDFLGMGGLIPTNITPLGNATLNGGNGGQLGGGGQEPLGGLGGQLAGPAAQLGGQPGGQPGGLEQPQGLLQGAAGLGGQTPPGQ